MPSRWRWRITLISLFRDTTCRSRTLTFCAPRQGPRHEVLPADWCKGLLAVEWVDSAAERVGRGQGELREAPVAPALALPDWSSPHSVPERRLSHSIQPSMGP